MQNLDQILLNGIRAVGFCGALPEEQERPQPFEVDLVVEADLRQAGESDELEDTIDYGSLGEMVVAIINQRRFVLIERMAEVIAASVLEDARAESVSVTVKKLRPPVPFELETSAVRIQRHR